MPFASLEGLRQEMIRLGVVRLLFKVLSTNDNSKQQIYLGSGYDSLKMIPGRASCRTGTQPKAWCIASADNQVSA